MTRRKYEVNAVLENNHYHYFHKVFLRQGLTMLLGLIWTLLYSLGLKLLYHPPKS